MISITVTDPLGSRKTQSAPPVSRQTEKIWELLEAHRPDLIEQARGIVGNFQDAEDIVQETFIEAARNFVELPAERMNIWLRAINRRNAVDGLRGKRSQSRRLETRQKQTPADYFTTGGFSQLELRESLNSAMQALPAQLRNVVMLRYWRHFSYKQIAEELNIPIGTVSALLMDAFAALFSRLQLQEKLAWPAPGDERETSRQEPV